MNKKKGSCYKNAVQEQWLNPEYIVCHGICTGQGQIEGLRYGHAWVEYEKDGIMWAYDMSADVELPAMEYRAIGKITDVKEYKHGEVQELVKSTEIYGPWCPVINAAVHLQRGDRQ